MRYINIILCLLMILFIVVQYNDPDGPMWMVIYLIPAIWAGIGSFRPALLSKSVPSALLLLCIAAALAGTVYFWPDMPHWWKMETWVQELTGEKAREGMGMMILSVVLIIVWLSGRREAR